MEANSRMILHAYQVYKNAFSIVIWTAGTDALVLAIAARCDNKHLRVSFGVGDSHKVLDVSTLKTAIG